MPEELIAGGAGKDGKITIVDAANAAILEVRRKDLRPGVFKMADLRLGAQDILGTLSLQNRANERRALLTGDGSLSLGGAGASA
jgi:hypothetical protein